MSRFRTVRVSDPRYERDHLRCVTVKSPALRARGDLTLFVPPQSEGLQAVPLVILLHGVYGSHWSWAMGGGAHLTALDLIEAGRIGPLVIAMPSDGLWGDGSGYLSHAAADYERWIVEDVVAAAAEVAPCVDAHARFFIAGLSMGGYGALRLGAKYAPRVAAISGHSSITHPRQLAQFVEEPPSAYGSVVTTEDADVLHWMMRHKETLPPLRFDCGAEDQLIEENRELHRRLDALGVAHAYEEFPGAHSWDYWREHLADTLLFFARCAGDA
jgi:putative tributyrin esterase